MKSLPLIASLLIGPNAFAATPYCNIAEVQDGMPTLTSRTREFTKGERLNLATTDGSAHAIIEWKERYGFYQILLFHGDSRSSGIFDLPAKSGYVSHYDGKRLFQAQCRFELD